MTATINDKITVSMVRNAKATATKNAPLVAILDQIKSGKWRSEVDPVRVAFREYGKAEADTLKCKLPGVLFSGSFTKRNNKSLVQHSGIICIDIDSLGDQINEVRKKIDNDPFTFASFVSPSGTGLKVLVRMEPDPAFHSEAFDILTSHYDRNHGLMIDTKCRDLARLCFVSFDPDLLLNPDAEQVSSDIVIQDIQGHSRHSSDKYSSQVPHDPKTPAGVFMSISHHEKVEAVLLRTLPTGQGQRHRCVFNLARGLKHDAGCADVPLPELKKIVRQWFERAIDHIATKEFSETWADFIHAWDYVHTGLDAVNPVASAWKRVESEPMPTICDQYDSVPARRLLALCHFLKRDDGTFYLSMPQAGTLIQRHPQQVRRYLKMFVAEGLFRITIKGIRGTRGKATTYQWNETTEAK